jgi:predicted hydrolase (HD superfamily)
MSKYYVGDVGTEVLVDTGSDISTATVMRMYVKKPSGKEETWTAIIGPPNAIGVLTKMKYIVKQGDWDEAGWWTLQAYVELPGWKGRGDSVKFKLEPEFK